MKKLELRRLALSIGLFMAIGLAGCGGGGGEGNGAAEPTPPPAAPAPDRATVTIRGTVLESGDGARVEVPASASLYEFEASIATSTEGAPALPPELAAMGSMVSLQPHGAVFTMPIRVSLPFNPAAVPAGATVKVARGQPGGRWEILPGTVEGNRIHIATSGFSYYMPVIIQTGTYVFPVVTPFGEVTAAGLTPVAAQSPQAFLANGDPNPQIPVVNYRVYTQAQLATPVALTLRGAVPTGSSMDLSCGTRELRLVVTAFSARVYPDPANASRTLVRTNRSVRMQGGFGWDDPVELASLPVPRDGQTRSLNFNLNLAHHAYRLGPDDYPPDPWTGGPATFDPFWGGPDPLPLTGSAGLTLATHYTCNDVTWYMEYDQSPKAALRRGFADTVAFTALPADVTVVEGEPAEFRASLATAGSTTNRLNVVVKWQRALAAAPQAWSDLDPDTVSQTAMAGWETSNRSNFTLLGVGNGLIRRPTVTRAEHDGTLLRAVACEYITSETSITRGACINSPPARLTVTQDFVAPQVLTSPTPQITVRENAAGTVTQFSATFSGVPRPVVRWETRAPGSPQWDPVDPAAHVLNGATLSTSRAFTLADRGREYRAVASNAGGSTTSFSSVLFVTTGLEPPAITTQPQDASVAAGSAVLFAASVTGSAPMSYQWYYNGSAIAGANGPLLTLNSVNAANAGNYQLEAGNRENRVRSRLARLTVSGSPANPPPVAAPRIQTPPASLTVTAGNSATFAVGAAGTEPLAYQWFKDDQAIAGATASALTLAAVAESQAGRYAVTVRNAGGLTRSTDAVLTVRPANAGPSPIVAPTIATPPTGLAVIVGQGATFAVAASGSAPLAYQWRRNGVPITGANGPILTLASVGVNEGGQYSVVVGNTAGQVVSADAGLVVTPVPGAPAITAQPGPTTVVVGQSASFSGAVSGNPAPLCLWLRDGIVIPGATDCTGYTTPPLAAADSGTVYNLFAYSPGGHAFAGGAVVSVTAAVAPTFTMQPSSQSIPPGGSTSFTVTATGAPGPTIEWGVNGVLLGTGGRYVLATCAFDHQTVGGTLTLSNVTADCSGSHLVALARNGAGTATSNAAVLTVTPVAVTATLLAGSPGVTGSADGPADVARFSTPNYLTVARDGSLAIGDFGNSTIRIIAGTQVSTLAGTPGAVGFADGTGSAARFAGNGGLAYNSAGHLFVADWDNHVIRRITPQGEVTTFAGSPGAPGSVDGTGSAARMSNPNGLVVDASDNVYFVDWGNHTIRKITPAGVVSTFAGAAGQRGQVDGQGSAARFNVPGGLAIDGAGNLYVTDMFNHAIRKITPAGEVSTLAGSLGLSGTADGTGSAARFEQPAWITSTTDGTLFVVSAAGDTVRRVTSAGVVETVAGVLGDSAVLRLGANPRLRNARGILAVSAQELLVNADQALIRVRLP